MKKQPSFLGTLIFAAVFFIGGLMAYQHLTKPIAEEAEASKELPTVEGVIAHAELNKSRDSDGNDMYSANINYDYTVDGKQLNSSGVRTVDGSTSSKSSVKKTLQKYAKGTKVTVHYDPEFPNSAVLEPGTGFFVRNAAKTAFTVLHYIRTYGAKSFQTPIIWSINSWQKSSKNLKLK